MTIEQDILGGCLVAVASYLVLTLKNNREERERKDKEHREEREEQERKHREEREALAKTSEKQFDRVIEVTNKVNDSFNKSSDLLTGVKTLLEHRK